MCSNGLTNRNDIELKLNETEWNKVYFKSLISRVERFTEKQRRNCYFFKWTNAKFFFNISFIASLSRLKNCFTLIRQVDVLDIKSKNFLNIKNGLAYTTLIDTNDAIVVGFRDFRLLCRWQIVEINNFRLRIVWRLSRWRHHGRPLSWLGDFQFDLNDVVIVVDVDVVRVVGGSRLFDCC